MEKNRLTQEDMDRLVKARIDERARQDREWFAEMERHARCALLPSPETLDTPGCSGSDVTDTLGDFCTVLKWTEDAGLLNTEFYQYDIIQSGRIYSKEIYGSVLRSSFGLAFDAVRHTASPDLEELVVWYYAGHGLDKKSASKLSYSSAPQLEEVQMQDHLKTEAVITPLGAEPRKVKGGELCLHHVGFCDLRGLLGLWIAALEAKSQNSTGVKKNKHLVIISDSCYSGVLAKDLEELNSKGGPWNQNGCSVTVQAACGENEATQGGYFTPTFEYLNKPENQNFLLQLKEEWASMSEQDKKKYTELALPSPVVATTYEPVAEGSEPTLEMNVQNFQLTLFCDAGFFKYCHHSFFMDQEKKILQALGPDRVLNVASANQFLLAKKFVVFDYKLKIYKVDTRDPPQHQNTPMGLFLLEDPQNKGLAVCAQVHFAENDTSKVNRINLVYRKKSLNLNLLQFEEKDVHDFPGKYIPTNQQKIPVPLCEELVNACFDFVNSKEPGRWGNVARWNMKQSWANKFRKEERSMYLKKYLESIKKYNLPILAPKQPDVCPIHQLTAEFKARFKECKQVLLYKKGKDSAVVTFYVFAGNGGIPKSLIEEAEECFRELRVKLEWIDLFNDPPRVLPVGYPSGFQTLPTSAATDISKVIRRNLARFSQHSNITGIHPSFKVKHFQQTNTPCIAVYVLGKGCVPLGEHRIPCVIGGFPVDILEGFWFECTDDLVILRPQESRKPLKLGVSIGREGVNRAGTLGAFVEDEKTKEVFLLSCDHVLRGTEGETEIIQPSLRDNVRALRNIVDNYKQRAVRYGIPNESEEDHGEYDQDHKERIREEFNSFCETHQEHLQDHDSAYMRVQEIEFEEIYDGEPRIIAKYTCGIQGNQTLQGEEGRFYIDAGIAKLEGSEIDELVKLTKKGTVQLCNNSKANLGQCKPVKDIVAVDKVHKCGRGTSNTKGFLLSREVYLKGPSYQNIRCGCNRPTQLSYHVAFSNYYCKACAEGSHPNRTEGSNPNGAEHELHECVRCHQTAMCLPYSALQHHYCESCTEKSGINWDDTTNDSAPDIRICALCKQIKQCLLLKLDPRYLCSSCVPNHQVSLTDHPSLKTYQKCEDCGKLAICLPYHEREEEQEQNRVDQDHALDEELWCHNSLLIRNLRTCTSFANSGDSGAVIFDDENNAVGLLFACFMADTLSTIYALACPIELVLNKLSEKTGRSLKLKTQFTDADQQ